MVVTVLKNWSINTHW